MQATVTPDTKEELQHNMATISRCIYGNWITQITYVFAELGIADQLTNGPRTLNQLATGLEVKEDILKRVLRCTFELEYLTFDQTTNLYNLTPRGALLSQTHPNSMREEARLNGADYRYFPWGNLLKMLRNGLSEEYSPTFKNGSLDYLKDKPELLNTFHTCLLYTSPSPRDATLSRMPSSA